MKKKVVGKQVSYHLVGHLQQDEKKEVLQQQNKFEVGDVCLLPQTNCLSQFFSNSYLIRVCFRCTLTNRKAKYFQLEKMLNAYTDAGMMNKTHSHMFRRWTEARQWRWPCHHTLFKLKLSVRTLRQTFLKPDQWSFTMHPTLKCVANPFATTTMITISTRIKSTRQILESKASVSIETNVFDLFRSASLIIDTSKPTIVSVF